jgi:hypothetical protein
VGCEGAEEGPHYLGAGGEEGGRVGGNHGSAELGAEDEGRAVEEGVVLVLAAGLGVLEYALGRALEV